MHDFLLVELDSPRPFDAGLAELEEPAQHRVRRVDERLGVLLQRVEHFVIDPNGRGHEWRSFLGNYDLQVARLQCSLHVVKDVVTAM